MTGRERESARNVAPDDVAAALRRLPSLCDHSRLLGRDEVEQGIARRVREVVRLQQGLDLLARAASEERQLIADRLRPS